MAMIQSLLTKGWNRFLLTLSFLFLSLIAVFYFTTDGANRFSFYYFPSPQDLESSRSIRSPLQSPLGPPAAPVPVTPSSPYSFNEQSELVEGVGEANETDGEQVNPEFELRWEICRSGMGFEAVDYIPCLDNMKAIKKLKSRRHMEHRERHCPTPAPRCLVPLPPGYKVPVSWPKSRDMIWFDNVPHSKLVEYKKDQNWVRKDGDYLVFPGGGTQFKEGVSNYIQFIEQSCPAIEWGRHTRVVLDVGCGVASFGGYLLDNDVITISFAPKDEHEAQIQFALERGIPAFLSVIGTQQLTFPDNAFDLIHCARCRVHWDGDGGKPLIELNRILRPGGFFVWSATPVYRDDPRDQSVWNAMVTLTESICWKLLVKATDAAGIGLVIYQKPVSSACYEKRKVQDPPLCIHKNRYDISWYTPLEGCLPPVHVDDSVDSETWPSSWPERLNFWPSNLLESNNEYNKARYYEDTKHWKGLVSSIYMDDLSINWSSIRNVMDMNAGFGGFAAALVKEALWVMNVVPIHELNTLPIIINRGLIGVYHDWCESFNTYPRTYDLLHSSFLFGKLTKRCDIISCVAEMDRILRPGGLVLIQDTREMITNLSLVFKSLQWVTSIHDDSFLVCRKSFWRPL
ncbi:hypothetical protein HPP92_007396 [Vanilla planifolia]|uniref:Methyltransferase n=1 Tax=Vanilla planifolia TaxID=51239 RepID=A0A835RQT0_VANPL|nr:hypothetical protein HPP92_007396 [Vanilla planifolia]